MIIEQIQNEIQKDYKRCKYWKICKYYDPLLLTCNQNWKNEWCTQYITFEEMKGNAPYFVLKTLGRLSE